MIYTGLNRSGEIEQVYAHGGSEVSAVYGSIGESNPIFYSRKTLTGTSPLAFKGLGQPLTDYTILGNSYQDGTPSPDDPVEVVECGIWDETQQSYKLPITCGGTECPIYLGQVETTRKVKKLVLTGEENWTSRTGQPSNVFFLDFAGAIFINNHGLCTHYLNQDSGNFDVLTDKHVLIINSVSGKKSYIGLRDSSFSNGSPGVSEVRAYLAAQYAAGTPVTVWYALAEPETGIVNEPLHKIGDYADIISMAQAGVTIPTASGENVLTVPTEVPPSSVSITGHIKPVTS